MIHFAPVSPPPTPPGEGADSQAGFELVDLDLAGTPGHAVTPRPDALEAACGSGAGVWLRSVDPAALEAAAQRCRELGPASQRVVLECPPAAVARLAAAGWLVAVCPDDLGAEPGGAMEGVVTGAMADGARVVRSVHAQDVARVVHICSALLAEQQGGA